MSGSRSLLTGSGLATRNRRGLVLVSVQGRSWVHWGRGCDVGRRPEREDAGSGWQGEPPPSPHGAGRERIRGTGRDGTPGKTGRILTPPGPTSGSGSRSLRGAPSSVPRSACSVAALVSPRSGGQGWPLLEGSYFGAESIDLRLDRWRWPCWRSRSWPCAASRIPRGSRFVGNVLAGLVLAGTAAIGLHQAFDPGLINWPESGYFRAPSVTPMTVAPLIALGSAHHRPGRPRFRWTNWLIPLIGLALLVGLLSRGYQAQVLFSMQRAPLLAVRAPSACVGSPSASCSCGPTGVSPDSCSRSGPGPSMARLLTPVVAVIPMIMAIGQGLSRRADARHAGPRARARRVDRRGRPGRDHHLRVPATAALFRQLAVRDQRAGRAGERARGDDRGGRHDADQRRADRAVESPVRP